MCLLFSAGRTGGAIVSGSTTTMLGRLCSFLSNVVSAYILSFVGVFPSRRHCVSLNGISDLKVGPGTYRVRIAVWPWHIIVVESTLAVLPRQHV